MNSLLVPQELGDAVKAAFGGNRALCILPNGFSFHCALMGSKNGGFYITVGKKTLKRAGLEGDEVLEVVLRKDESEFQAPMPEELAGVLETDFEAWERFEALTKGKQRSIIHQVASAKHIDTRINRALKIAENLKKGASKPGEFLR